MIWHSILVDGKDASKISLREVDPDKSPAEWRKRGRNLMDNKLYGASDFSSPWPPQPIW